MATIEIPDDLIPEGYRVEYRETHEGDEILRYDSVQFARRGDGRALVLIRTTRWRDARISDLENAPRQARFRDADDQEWHEGILSGCRMTCDIWHWKSSDTWWNYCQVEVPADEREPREFWVRERHCYPTATPAPSVPDQIHVREILPSASNP